MAKWYGEIGFSGMVNDAPGVWTDQIVESRRYFGDVIQTRTKYSASDKVNDDVTVTSKISILSDDFAITNIPRMKYVDYLGVRWKIVEVEPRYPRLILTLGGMYNG